MHGPNIRINDGSCPQIIELYGSVPTSTDYHIRILGMKFDRENPIRMSRVTLPTTGHHVNLLSRLFIIQVNMSVRSRNCEHPTIKRKIQSE
jgi:hypothetical protein